MSHAPRIIAGSLRGRRLIVPNDGVRPTKDRVKASIFSALDARGLLTDAVVLDAYAGSGALGFEALSRGAASVVLVENDRAALVALRSSVASFGVGDQVKVVSQSIESVSTHFSSTFDVAFVDPPYSTDSDRVAEVLAQICANTPGGTVVVERPRRGGAVAIPDGWAVMWERRFGDTLVQFIQPEFIQPGQPDQPVQFSQAGPPEASLPVDLGGNS